MKIDWKPEAIAAFKNALHMFVFDGDESVRAALDAAVKAQVAAELSGDHRDRPDRFDRRAFDEATDAFVAAIRAVGKEPTSPFNDPNVCQPWIAGEIHTLPYASKRNDILSQEWEPKKQPKK